MMKSITFSLRLFILCILIISVTGCLRTTVQLTDVPSKIFTLQDEVMAVKCVGKSGRAAINLDPLRQKIEDFDDVTVWEFKDGIVEREIFYEWSEKGRD
ncbi:MAG: hypothetical protein ACFFCW_31660 [Candidatus Hodarchaeota archaeon]